MIEAGLHGFLTDDTDIAAIVATRVYPIILPQNPTMPAITYQRISTPRVSSTTGPSGLASPRIQVDCWAETYAAVKALSDTVRTAVDGYSGTMDTFTVYGVIVESEQDLYEPDAVYYRTSLDLIIWHKE